MFIEFPKALYCDGAELHVQDEQGEHDARNDGYTDWHSDRQRMADEAAAPSRDALKAQAKELGINHAQNISTANLAELVAAAQKDA